ncbi:cell division protein ZapE [Candidatus Lariskella endosymbiont of Hedychridium roseum]|uniref:cell division protein ZapE n=1 Tax=Candidatus Lariskella endosymbiont of Hedychridium roseum TaxID=3077949 RepID=UPI0030CFE3AB
MHKQTIQFTYAKLLESSAMSADPKQLELIKMFDTYKTYIENLKISRFTFFALKEKIYKKLNKQKGKKLAMGIYIWGGTGRGKSMLMKIFFDNLAIKQKQIMHFHKFMLDFHTNLNNLQKSKLIASSLKPLEIVAGDIIKDCKVLCLDELQVNNIADAMVLLKLFEFILSNGVFVFITSNFEPQKLFEGGLQRQRFLPFIDLLEHSLDIFHLDNNHDYRSTKVKGIEKLYHFPLDDTASDFIKNVLSKLIGSNNILAARSIDVHGSRSLTVKRSFESIALFDFAELCNVPLGVNDYIAICKVFDVIIIENIPKMCEENHNEALRFITLIDEIYEAKTRLICTADVSIDNLYSGKKHKTEFARLVSRLYEMQSIDY